MAKGKTPKTKTVTVSAYDKSKTLEKFFLGLLYAIIPVILVYVKTFIQGPDFPLEYAAFIPIIVALVAAFENWWKHHSDTKTTEVPV